MTLTQSVPTTSSIAYLTSDKIYACSGCGIHLASHEDIISKAFHGVHGRALLLQSITNVIHGPREERILLTGSHIVCDIRCIGCKADVGWSYLYAAEPAQKYKEGKYILERFCSVKIHNWDISV